MSDLSEDNSSRLKVLQYLEFNTIRYGSTGGTENILLTLCENLDPNEFELTITCFPPKSDIEFVHRAANRQIPIIPFPTRRIGTFSYLKRMLWLAWWLRHNKIDVLHAHTGGFEVTAVLVAGFLARTPAVVVSHHTWYGPRPYSRASYVGRWLERRLVSRAVASYQRQAEEMQIAGIPSARIALVPYGVDMTRFTRKELHVAKPAHVTRFICIARMEDGKGHLELVDAFAQAFRNYSNLHLTIVGDGPMRGIVVGRVHELNLERAVEITGWVENGRVPDLLRSALVTVLPTYWPGEAFPFTLLEGMAMGLAAIGTRWKGIGDMIVDGETGFLVEPRDVQQLAHAIERMAANPSAACEMGRKGRARALQLYSAQAMARSMRDVYWEALQERGGPISGRHGRASASCAGAA